MGMVAAVALLNISFGNIRMIIFAILIPPFLTVFGIVADKIIGLESGSILVLASLTASASYIAALVAIRTAIPKADIGLVMLAS